MKLERVSKTFLEDHDSKDKHCPTHQMTLIKKHKFVPLMAFVIWLRC